MGSPKVDIREVLLRLDGLDGVSDQNYYGINLSGPNTTLGLCLEGNSKEEVVSLYNTEGTLVNVDCKALAAKLDQLIGAAEENPASALFSSGRFQVGGDPLTDEEIRCYALVDGWLKALLLGNKTAADIAVENLVAEAAKVSIGWDDLP